MEDSVTLFSSFNSASKVFIFSVSTLPKDFTISSSSLISSSTLVSDGPPIILFRSSILFLLSFFLSSAFARSPPTILVVPRIEPPTRPAAAITSRYSSTASGVSIGIPA